MMDYTILIETLSEIVNNDKIYKEGLILTYKLPEKLHGKMHEELYYRSNPADSPLPDATDEYEVEINDIIVTFIKK